MERESKDIIQLPGGKNQFDFLLSHANPGEKSILVAGSSSEQITVAFRDASAARVELIVEDYDSLMNSKMILQNDKEIAVKMMDFEFTDYPEKSFDIIYAQGSISNGRRKGILKEFRRILKPEGLICIGEIVKLRKDVPVFIQNVFDGSDLNPLFVDDVNSFYVQRQFEVVASANFSSSLKNYYFAALQQIKSTGRDLTPNEKSYYKKLINRISHESQVYLKQGGEKFIGFVALLVKNKS
jgi:ubiquinone/menaquinone biosynthesis C-methylase UbiE